MSTQKRSGLALAVDLGGTKVESALVERTGALVPGSRFRRPTGRDASSDQLWNAVQTVVELTLDRLDDRELAGAGVGAAGPIRADAGLVSPLNLPAWRDFPLRDRIAQLVPGLPIALHIDGLAIALAEHWVGAAREADNVLGMVVSTGIGGGLILGGKAIGGGTGNAGHIGHVEVGGFETVCECGGSGCLEAIASGPKTVQWARSRGWPGNSGEELATAYAAGDEIAIAAVERAGRAIGRAIASATSLVDLDLVAIGGGFSRVTPDLFDFIRAGIDERRAFGFVTRVQVVPTGLSDEGPLIGAAALVHRAALVP